MGGGEYIDQLGHIFTSKYNHIPQYREWGIKHVSHLPLACDPDMHKEVEAEKVYDIIFLGNLGYVERKHFLGLLRLKYNVFVGTGFIYDGYSKKIAQAKICFNHGHVGELNMRFFELMVMGAFQICNIVHAQELLGFEDRVHLVNYVFEEDLVNVLEEYLRGGEEPFLTEKRRKIAQAGKEKVLAEHTYQHRAEEILTICGLGK
jgi:spore maturation protein CgeB